MDPQCLQVMEDFTVDVSVTGGNVNLKFTDKEGSVNLTIDPLAARNVRDGIDIALRHMEQKPAKVEKSS